MKEYVIYQNEDGDLSAHTDNYSPKQGEREIGRQEADSGDKAVKKFKKDGGASASDDDSDDSPEAAIPTGLLARREPTAAEVRRDLEQARKAEEAKEDFEVMADSKGNPYVEGEDGDPNKSEKKAAKAEPPPEPEESSLGTFRAKDAAEAVRMAKGEHKQPAEGPQRGAQTP